MPTPCRECPKIPLGVPVPSAASAVELDARGWAAYRFYKRRRASGRPMPEDEACEQVAAALDDVIRECADIKQQRRDLRLLQGLTLAANSQPVKVKRRR